MNVESPGIIKYETGQLRIIVLRDLLSANVDQWHTAIVFIPQREKSNGRYRRRDCHIEVAGGRCRFPTTIAFSGKLGPRF